MASYSQVRHFGIINYLITFISIICSILGFFNIKNNTNKPKKIVFLLTFILFISLISVLVTWNMFVVLFPDKSLNYLY